MQYENNKLYFIFKNSKWFLLFFCIFYLPEGIFVQHRFYVFLLNNFPFMFITFFHIYLFFLSFKYFMRRSKNWMQLELNSNNKNEMEKLMMFNVLYITFIKPCLYWRWFHFYNHKFYLIFVFVFRWESFADQSENNGNTWIMNKVFFYFNNFCCCCEHSLSLSHSLNLLSTCLQNEFCIFNEEHYLDGEKK